MGGRIAEEIFIGTITTGASNDIEKATEVARAMVCEYGMSDLGPLTFGKKEEQIFLGREIAQHRDYSEDTAIKIDDEVKKIVAEQYERAEKILHDNKRGDGPPGRGPARTRNARQCPDPPRNRRPAARR